MVGGVIGWAAGLMMAHGDRVLILENVAVGVFGAFIGGDFVAAMLSTGIVNDHVFSVRSLGLAIAGAVTLLLILKAMCKAVGPLRLGKSPSRRRE